MATRAFTCLLEYIQPKITAVSASTVPWESVAGIFRDFWDGFWQEMPASDSGNIRVDLCID